MVQTNSYISEKLPAESPEYDVNPALHTSIQRVKYCLEKAVNCKPGAYIPSVNSTMLACFLRFSIVAQHKEIIILLKQYLQAPTDYAENIAGSICSAVKNCLSANPSLSKDEELLEITLKNLAANINILLNLNVLISLVEANSALANHLGIAQQAINFMGNDSSDIREIAAVLATRLIAGNPGLGYDNSLVGPIIRRLQSLPALIEAIPGFLNRELIEWILTFLQNGNQPKTARSNRYFAYSALHHVLKNPRFSEAHGFINNDESIKLSDAFFLYKENLVADFAEFIIDLYRTCENYRKKIHDFLTNDIFTISDDLGDVIGIKLYQDIWHLKFKLLISFFEIADQATEEFLQASGPCKVS